MTYNFTDGVRKVLAMAREESIHFQHDHVSPEHMLLALMREGDGVAAAALTNLAGDLTQLRLRIERMIRSGDSSRKIGELPYTAEAKRALEFAIREARELNHSYVATEHLLLGLILAEEEGLTTVKLSELGLDVSEVRTETLKLLSLSDADEQAGKVEDEVPAPSNLYPSLNELLRASAASKDPGRIVIIADTDAIPPSVIAEVMASLDALHRAWGGAGLEIEEDRVVSLETYSVLQ